MQLQLEILKTLLYYDIWSHPLTAEELYAFLPVNSISLAEFKEQLGRASNVGLIQHHHGYYFIQGKSHAVAERLKRARHARRMWFAARLGAHMIKRFPFVRAVFVSGDLSKNVTHSKSDVDFFIITEPDRLWIARTLLILFKKVFLFNSKKFFCLNSFVTSDHLTHDERNIYAATEIATLKPLYNSRLFTAYLSANDWIRSYFPNYNVRMLPLPRCNNRRSSLQKLLELPFRLFDATRLDIRLMKMMERVWARRYPHLDETTRRRIFRCTRTESRAYVGNFQEVILALYERRLRSFGIVPTHAAAVAAGEGGP